MNLKAYIPGFIVVSVDAFSSHYVLTFNASLNRLLFSVIVGMWNVF